VYNPLGVFFRADSIPEIICLAVITRVRRSYRLPISSSSVLLTRNPMPKNFPTSLDSLTDSDFNGRSGSRRNLSGNTSRFLTKENVMKIQKPTAQSSMLQDCEAVPEFLAEKRRDRSIFLWWGKRGIAVSVHPDLVPVFMKVMEGGYIQRRGIGIEASNRPDSHNKWYMLMTGDIIVELDEFELGRLRQYFKRISELH
jgi:hypothetical protein